MATVTWDDDDFLMPTKTRMSVGLLLTLIRSWESLQSPEVSVETPDEGEDLISVLHPRQSSQHRIPGDQIVRPDPVNGHNGRVAVHIRETLHDVSDAHTTSFGGEERLSQLASQLASPWFLRPTGAQCLRRQSLSHHHLASVKPSSIAPHGVLQ